MTKLFIEKTCLELDELVTELNNFESYQEKVIKGLLDGRAELSGVGNQGSPNMLMTTCGFLGIDKKLTWILMGLKILI